MKKFSPWQKFRYWFDNLMSKGTASLLLLLAVITSLVVVTGGLLTVALGGADGSGGAEMLQQAGRKRLVARLAHGRGSRRPFCADLGAQ